MRSRERTSAVNLPATSRLGAIGINNVLLLGASVIAETVSFWVLARRLGDGFTEYAVAVTLATVIAVFSNSWIRIGFYRSLRRQFDGAPGEGPRIGAYVLLSLIATALTVLLIASIAGRITPAGVGRVIIVGLATWSFAEAQGVLRISGHLQRPRILDVVMRVSFVGVALWAPADVDTMLFGLAATRVVGSSLAAAAIPWALISVQKPGAHNISGMARQHLPLLLAAVADYGILWSDAFVLRGYGADRDIGGVFIATRVFAVLITVLSLVSELVLPRMLQSMAEPSSVFEERTTTALVPVGVVALSTCCLLGIGLVIPLSSTVAGQLPPGTVAFFVGCLPAFCIAPAGALFKVALAARDKLSAIATGTVLSGVVKLSLCIALLPVIGAYAVPASLFCAFLAQSLYYRRALRAVGGPVPGLHLWWSPLWVACGSSVAMFAIEHDVSTRLLAVGCLVCLALANLATTRRLEVVSQRGLDAVANAGLPRLARIAIAWATGRRAKAIG